MINCYLLHDIRRFNYIALLSSRIKIFHWWEKSSSSSAAAAAASRWRHHSLHNGVLQTQIWCPGTTSLHSPGAITGYATWRLHLRNTDPETTAHVITFYLSWIPDTISGAVLAQKFCEVLPPSAPSSSPSPFFLSPKPKKIRTLYRPTFKIYH